MHYVTRSHDAREYDEHASLTDAVAEAWSIDRCDECRRHWTARAVLVHEARYALYTYATVVCLDCLPAVSERFQ